MTYAQFIQENIIMFILLAIVIVAIIVYELRNRGTGASKVTPSQAAQIANNGGKIIDVRPAAEYKKGHIAGAQSIPAEQFQQKVSAGKIKTDQAIVLVDSNGLSVNTHAKWLREQGYQHISVLGGGLLTWQEENLPLVK